MEPQVSRGTHACTGTAVTISHQRDLTQEPAYAHLRAPVKQLAELGPVGNAVTRAECAQWLGGGGNRVTHGHADLAQAEIESEYRVY